MHILIGLENGSEGRSQAWALEHPGCFAYGKDSREALMNVPRAVLAYQTWLDRHTPDSWLKELGDFDIRLVEAFEAYTIDEQYNTTDGEGYEVNAWFRHDWKPLTKVDIQRATQLLAFSRADLLELAGSLPAATLDQEHPGERWSIRGILAHLATAEEWYLHRLGLGVVEGSRYLPEDVFERLTVVRQRLESVLPSLADREQVVGVDGEFWSPRKLIRRAVWHERDHTEHILKLLV